MAEPRQDVERPRRDYSWLRSRYVAAGALAVLALIFIFENTERVHIRVIGPVVTARLWEALLATFLAGMLTLWLIQRRRHKADKVTKTD